MPNLNYYFEYRIPEDCEVDLDRLSKDRIISFKKKSLNLPKTYEEYCTKHKNDTYTPNPAVSAFTKLIKLRDEYNAGWRPDWDNMLNKSYPCIIIGEKNTPTLCRTFDKEVFTFKTAEIAKEFYLNFYDLLYTYANI